MVRVGEADDDQQEFVVYENLIRRSSEFFDNVLTELQDTSNERAICLPANHPAQFELYYHWLLTGKLYSKFRVGDSIFGDEIRSERLASANELSELYSASAIGHDLADTDFVDAVTDTILQWSTEKPFKDGNVPLYLGCKMYWRLPEGSPVRKLMVDLASSIKINDGVINELRQDSDPEEKERSVEFLLDILQVTASARDAHGSKLIDFDDWQTSCKHHCHGEEKACYRTRLIG